MSYIDAYYRRDDDKVFVVERDANGQRKFVDYDARYVFYYLLDSSTMAYSAYRRRNPWITILAAWFTLMNCIGNYLVFFK